MIYFISDTHFWHKGALLWNDGKVRPQFENVYVMNETMISNWNNIISNEDEVYFLGDFAYKCSKLQAETIFHQLNGKKHLIKGNHDYNLAASFINCWESISDIKQIDIIKQNGCKQEIIMCHYPMVSWRHKEQGSWHLHGHMHGSYDASNTFSKRLDVSVESHNYTPWSLDEIINHFNE